MATLHISRCLFLLALADSFLLHSHSLLFILGRVRMICLFCYTPVICSFLSLPFFSCRPGQSAITQQYKLVENYSRLSMRIIIIHLDCGVCGWKMARFVSNRYDWHFIFKQFSANFWTENFSPGSELCSAICCQRKMLLCFWAAIYDKSWTKPTSKHQQPISWIGEKFNFIHATHSTSSFEKMRKKYRILVWVYRNKWRNKIYFYEEQWMIVQNWFTPRLNRLKCNEWLAAPKPRTKTMTMWKSRIVWSHAMSWFHTYTIYIWRWW